MRNNAFMQFARGICIAIVVLALAAAAAQTAEDLVNPPPEEWPHFGRDSTMSHYSPLDQINRENVQDLRLVWSRAIQFDGLAQMSPAAYNGIMYIHGPDFVTALDATDGELLWEYRPEIHPNATGFIADRMRGSILIFEGRVYYGVTDGRLVALDAESGEEIWSTQIGDIETYREGFSAGPIFADGKIIIGPSGADLGGAPGRVVALDSQDGELLWTFNVIPGPGDPGYETWDPPPDPLLPAGGGSAWNVGAYDPETRTVVYGTGQPTPWDRFDRRFGDQDLYTASYIGMDVDTGEMKWYFQVAPADEWDYDQQDTATIADLEIDGETRRVAILTSTAGYIILLDVETGEFLEAHAMNPDYTVIMGFEEDGTPIIDEEARFEEEGEMMELCPFRYVWFEASAYSPDTGLYYRPNMINCYDYALYPLPDDWEPGDPGTNFELTLQADRYDRLGAVSAIDPVTGEVVWEFTHGYMQQGQGAIATGGNLVFAAFPDRIFRSFDAETGDLLWQQVLTAAMGGSPITYAVDGTQYVAVIAGTSQEFTGQTDLPPSVTGTPSVFVFALPEETGEAP